MIIFPVVTSQPFTVALLFPRSVTWISGLSLFQETVRLVASFGKTEAWIVIVSSRMILNSFPSWYPETFKEILVGATYFVSVDDVGGVEVDVHKNEINEINKFIKNETYKWSGETTPMQLIENSGVQKLNGYQTLSYARIRKNDSTQERDRRQRQVIEGLMNGVKNLPVSKYPKLLDTILPYVKTNMKPTQIIGLAGKVLCIGNLSVSQIEFPLENYSTPITLPSKGFVIKFDESSLDILHDFIFKNIIP